jgi:FkbM family methyltransferase
MECDLNFVLQRQFYFFGTYYLERENLACWEAHSKNAKVIFDVGANLGIYSLCATAISPKARIYSFEPTPSLVSHLKQTLTYNKITQVEVIQNAVSCISGQASLNFCGGVEVGNEGMNFVTLRARSPEAISIETITLDDFCSKRAIEQIDLLKIDIQGNEPAALDGAARLLDERRIRCIFTELNWATDPGQPCSASELIETLKSKGFLFALPIRGAKVRQAGDWMRGLDDVVAILPE